MAEPVRVDLTGTLAGWHVLVDPDRVTMGFLEDVQAGSSIPKLLDAVVGCLIGGRLPDGVNRDGLRALRPAQFQALLEAVTSTADLPKAP